MSFPTFPHHLIDAATTAEAGLRFEEGGCFAMALALTEKLVEMGIDAVPALMWDMNHAIVTLPEWPYLWLDHTGYHQEPLDHVQVGADDLREAALRSGWSEDEFEADLAWAREIVEATVEMDISACQERSPVP